MSNIITQIFGPLSKESCVYFLFVSILSFIILVLVLAVEMLYISSNLYTGKKITFRELSKGLVILANIFIAYFVNRLLYTMCSKSLI